MLHISLLALLVLNVCTAQAYVYRPGNKCPRPTDIGDGFDMDRFLGRWYVVQRSRTPMASCIVYNITRQHRKQDEDDDDEGRSNYRIEQITYLRPAERKYKLTYAGNLEANRMPNRDNNGTSSSRMSVKFPLNMIGRSTFDVFATDYTSYAGIFTCQPLLMFMHRQSATFLSRTPTMSAETKKLLRYRLYDDNIDALAMEDVSQVDCDDGDSNAVDSHPVNTFGVFAMEPKVRPLSTTTAGPERVVGDIVFPEAIDKRLVNQTIPENENASHIDSQLIWI